MSDLVKELTRLKKKAEDLRIAKAEATGRLEELYRQLRVNFNCESLAEGEAYMIELQKEKEQLQEELESNITEIKGLLDGRRS